MAARQRELTDRGEQRDLTPWRRQWTARYRRWSTPRRAVWWLSAVVVALAVLSPVIGVEWVPPGSVALPVLAGGLLLRRRALALVVLITAVGLGYDTLILGWHVIRVGQVVVVAVIAVFGFRLAAQRETLGVQGLRGESMLLELRERLRRQGEMPALPTGWHHEIAIRSADGGAFGGDFVVTGLVAEGSQLEVILVDVSGKGIDAGTRALLLSGALGGLLGSVEPGKFLPAASDYISRLHWTEGFATAVHLVVDLTTGHYVIESAGHPPAVHFVAGSGVWRMLEGEGTVLGVLERPVYPPVRGVLGHRDAILLYTDGLVETAEREVSVGIDKLIGEAERFVTQGFTDGANRLIDAVAPGGNDDRAIVLIWRD
jgi:hypothetical protein